MDTMVVGIIGAASATIGSVGTFLLQLYLGKNASRRDDFKVVTETALALAQRLDGEILNLRGRLDEMAAANVRCEDMLLSIKAGVVEMKADAIEIAKVSQERVRLLEVALAHEVLLRQAQSPTSPSA